MLKKLYNKTLQWSEHPKANYILGGVSLSESVFFPIPPDVLLIPMVLSKRHKAWIYALNCTIMSIVGAAIGYYLGAFLFEAVAQPIIDFYGYQSKFKHFQLVYHEWGILILLTAGLTPIPFKIFTIASGFVAINFPLYLIICFFARGLRFFCVAGLLYKYGEPIQAYIEKNLTKLFILFLLALFAGFYAIKFM